MADAVRDDRHAQPHAPLRVTVGLRRERRRSTAETYCTGVGEMRGDVRGLWKESAESEDLPTWYC